MASCIDRLWIIVFLLFWLVPGVVLAKLLEKKISFLACLKGNVIGYVAFGLFINLGISVVLFLMPRPVDKILRIVYLAGGLIWGIILLWRARHDIRLRVDWWLLALGMGLLAGQLCFSNQLILPSNTDSITHYRYIVQFLNWREEGLGLFEFIRRLRFYHYGFHLLVSEIHALKWFCCNRYHAIAWHDFIYPGTIQPNLAQSVWARKKAPALGGFGIAWRRCSGLRARLIPACY